MIRCPKCDAENQIGAIFCRGCGEKLDLDELQPEKVRSAAKQQAGSNINWFAVIKNIIMLGILVVLLGILAGLFMKPSMPEVGEISAGQRKASLAAFADYRNGQSATVTLNQEQANVVIRDLLGLGSEEEIAKIKEDYIAKGQVGMMTTGITVELLAENRMRVFMNEQHVEREWQKWTSVITVQLEADPKTGIKVKEVESCAQGKIPLDMTSFSQEKIENRFITLTTGKQELNEIIKGTDAIKISDGKISLKGQMKRREGNPRNSTKKKRNPRSRRRN